MRNDSTVYVELDIHKESIVAAYSIGFDEVHDVGEIGILQRDLDRLCTRMQSKREGRQMDKPHASIFPRHAHIHVRLRGVVSPLDG